MTVSEIIKVSGGTGMPIAIADDCAEQEIIFSGWSENVPEVLRHKQVSFLEPTSQVRIVDEFSDTAYYESGFYIGIRMAPC